MSCPGIQNEGKSCGCSQPPKPTNFRNGLLYFTIALIGGILLVSFNIFKGYEDEVFAPKSLGMVFVLGFLTGLHCIGMCGGFMVSYVRFGKKREMSPLRMHSRYAIAKIVSYSTLGALFALLGSVVYFTTDLKANISYIAGAFLLYLGAKGLGLFKSLRLPKITDRVQAKSDQLSNPISVGLLNGLMISCAPLQALYLLSASLGDPLNGALLLGVFALGTLPIFLFYGVIVNGLARFRLKWSDHLTAGIIVVFGILMVNRGMALSGNRLDHLFQHDKTEISSTALVPQTVTMTADRSGWGKSKITLQSNTKVRWEIDVEQLTYCNKTIEIPALGIKKELKKGLNIIEFEPGNHQTLTYTCWMGMLTGKFVIQ